MAKVFVSYSRKDIEFARRLTAELHKCELDFWIDWEGIPPTVDWWKEIEKGIEEADIFLFLISPDSAKSKVCGQEIDTAVKNAKRIIPLVVRDITGDEAPHQLSHLNWIFFRPGNDFDGAFQKLQTAIHTDYEWVQQHRWLQVRALDWARDNKDKSSLLRGSDLQDAELQLAKNTSKEPHPTDLQREYVFESRKATDKQRRTITSVSIAGVALLAVLTIVAIMMAVKATIQAKISRAGELSALALSKNDEHYNLAILLGLEAYRTWENSRTLSTLLALADSHPGLELSLSGHTDTVSSVAFSSLGQTGDYILASGSWDNTIRLWNGKTHQPIGPHLKGHTDRVSCLAFSQTGDFILASGSWDNTIRLWNGKTHQPIGPPLKGHTDHVTSLVISPDGSLLASGSDDKTVILWKRNGQDGAFSIVKQLEFLNTVTSVAISPDHKLLVAGGSNQIMVWDLTDLDKPTLKNQLKIKGPVSSLAFDPNGAYLAIGNIYYSVEVYDGKSFFPINSLPLAHGSSVLNIAFNQLGTRLAAGSDDNLIRVWDMSNPDRLDPLETLSGSTSGVTSISFSPDGEHLASGGSDNAVLLWDITKPTVPSHLATLQGHGDPISSVAFSNDGKYLASGGYDQAVFLWNMKTTEGFNLNGFYEHSGAVIAVNFSPDGRLLASGSWADHTLVLWDVNEQKVKKKISAIQKPIYSLAFSPNGNFLAVGSEMDADNSTSPITLWNVSNPTTPSQIDARFSGHTYRAGKLRTGVASVAFSPDGNTLASGGSDKNIILWDVSNPESPLKRRTLSGHTDSVLSVAFSHNGKLLASGSDDGTVILWNTATYKQVSILRGHHRSVTSVAFSPDDQKLVSGSQDFTAILWDISNPKSPYKLAIRSENEWINGVAFNPDGKSFATAGDSHIVELWNINNNSLLEMLCQRVGRNFTQDEWSQFSPDTRYPTKPNDAPCPKLPLAPVIIPTQISLP